MLCRIYSINKRPTIEYTRRGQGCLHRGSVVFFTFLLTEILLFEFLMPSGCKADLYHVKQKALALQPRGLWFLQHKVSLGLLSLYRLSGQEKQEAPRSPPCHGAHSASPKVASRVWFHSGSVFSLGGGTAACHSFTLAPSLPLVPFFLPAFCSFYVSLCQTLCQVRRIKGSIKPRRGLTGGLDIPQGSHCTWI